MKSILLLTLPLSLSFVTPAFAEEPAPAEPKVEQVYKKRTMIMFSETNVNGTVVGPEGSHIYGRGKARFRTLIRIRDNFFPEILNSVEALK